MRKLDRPDAGRAAIGRRDWRIALIDGSDDAIVSADLDGIVQSWNEGATRLFGYTADEAIGRPMAMLIPADRLAEEAAMLTQIQGGQRVARFETKRRRKDGSLVDISLTLSVIRNADGAVVGASKIARDITERLLAQEQQRLLMYEMRHRMKNLFALAGAIVSISARSSDSDRLIADVRARLSALARAHDMAMAERPYEAGMRPALSLVALTRRILDPYTTADGQVTIGGDDCEVGAKAVSYVSLLLHELATNAAKFGALSVTSGRLDVRVAAGGELVRLVWRETGGPIPATDAPAGFGNRLERSVTGALQATIARDWRPSGLVATIAVPRVVLLV